MFNGIWNSITLLLHYHGEYAVKRVVLSRHVMSAKFIRLIVKKKFLGCYPAMCKIEVMFFEMKLDHLECLHETWTDVIACLCVNFHTRRKDTFTGDSRGLNQ
jgi:hypothetical protein